MSQEADREDDDTPDQSSQLEDDNADIELEDTLDIQQQEENGSRTSDIEDSQVDDITSKGSEVLSNKRDFIHPASAGFRYERASGTQFRFNEGRERYIKRGRRHTGFWR